LDGCGVNHIDTGTLAELLGIEVLALEPEPVVAGGGHSRIFACRTATDELILRVCQGRQGYCTHDFPDRVTWDDWMDQHWAIASARAPGIPAPEILCADRDRRWVVMRRLPGVPIEDYLSWPGCTA